MSYNKIETDYPMVDTLIHVGKTLMMDTILKDEDEVGKYETLDISRIANTYIQCRRGLASFDMFNYTVAQLNEVGLTADDPYVFHANIPKEYHDKLLKIAVRDFINNYEEQNDYYRTFCGLPPLDDDGIKITEQIAGVNNKIPLHKMTTSELNVLEGLGILDKYRELYPDAEYLNYLGSLSIDPYLLRTLPRFGIIYMPQVSITEIKNRYREKIENARTYALTCLYKDAMLYKNDYYNKFIIIFIKIQAMCDLLMDIPDMIIRKDVFDLRTVKYIFESSGITYFEEIPMKYQLAMLKNMNTLLTFKSTTKNMVDICSLFGFKNVELFKYYILRARKVDENGEYLFDTVTEINQETGQYETVDDYVNNFELKFIKVPIDGILDNYIRDDKCYVSYEDMTKDDPFWCGGNDKDTIYKQIISREFNIERSKYLSIDTIYEMDKLTFETCYFFNMIMDDVFLEDNLNIKVYKISEASINIKHAIMYLYLLNYEQSGLQDDIVSDAPSKVLSVMGFNFQLDFTKLSEYLMNNHVTLEQLGIDEFIIPTEQILTFNQLTNIFLTNKKIYDHIIYQMKNANDADIYRIYEDIYNALMVTDVSNKVYQLPDGSMAKTYTEYFLYNNIDIYNHISNIRLLDGKEKENAISDTMIEILSSLEDYINCSEFDYLFMNMPMIGNVVKQYIYTVINFYKSYKIQLDKINTVYRFDDVIGNKIKVIDTMRWISAFDVKTYTEFDETPMFEVYNTLDDKIPIRDEISIGWGLDLGDKPDDPEFIGINREEIWFKIFYEFDDINHFMFQHELDIKVINTYNDSCIPEDMIEITRI